MDKYEALDWFLRRKSMCLDDKCQAAEDIAIECIMRAIDGDWISVKDRLPDEQGTYLVFREEPYGMITIAWYSGHENGWLALDGGFYADGVLTHYMPLPEPPKEET